MTTIAATKVSVAADGLETISDAVARSSVPKIFEREGLVFGLAGNGEAFEDLIKWFLDGAHHETYPKHYGSKWNFLVFFSDICHAFDEDGPRPAIYTYPCAFGSGRDFAKGALATRGCDAREAVWHACKLSVHSGGRILKYKQSEISSAQWQKTQKARRTKSAGQAGKAER